MQDTELFLSLAEITGVFVGFGALIAVRSAGPGNVIRGGGNQLGVVMAASRRRGLGARPGGRGPVWRGRSWGCGWCCSVFALVLFWGGFAVSGSGWAPSSGGLRRGEGAPLRARAGGGSWSGVAVWLPATVALLLVVLGVVPDQEAALYFAAVVLFLMMETPSSCS